MGTSTAAERTRRFPRIFWGFRGIRRSAQRTTADNQIEGRLEKGQKVVVVEDLISTGGSVIEVVDVLREAGAVVLGVVSIFTYGMKKGLERLAAANVKNVSLTDFDSLVKVAVAEGYIKAEDEQKLLRFRANPSDESWITAINSVKFKRLKNEAFT